MEPMTIAAIAQAGAGILQTGQWFIQQAQAKKIARKNPRPKYTIPSTVKDNLDLTENLAGTGLSDAARTVFTQEQERGLTSALEAVLKGGGSVNNIADLYGKYTTGIAKMAIIDDEMRAQNIRNLIQQNNEMASFKDKEWQVNVFAPYADKAQAAAQLKKQGSDNLWKGINAVGGAAANYAIGNEYANQADAVFAEQKRVNDAYIDSLGRTTPQPVQNNTTIVPIQQGQTFYPVTQQPYFNPGSQNMGGPYNWMYGNNPVPTNPNAPQQKSTYQILREKYPGLMYGNNFGN